MKVIKEKKLVRLKSAEIHYKMHSRGKFRLQNDPSTQTNVLGECVTCTSINLMTREIKYSKLRTISSSLFSLLF